MKLLLGDCIDKLKELDDNSIDSIVTDPPYGLSFMGKKWDYDVPSQEIWEECYRVLKPGGHLLSFAGSRTYHRMAVRVEDAGFEIRDQILWIYGSGFPKSHNIGKAVDKLQGNEREVVETTNSRDRTKHNANTIFTGQNVSGWNDSKGNSPYEGWGTALKPAHEPIVMARKPFKGTVAQNVLEWGTGGINIDGCRIATNDDLTRAVHPAGNKIYGKYKTFGQDGQEVQPEGGRFPANIIFDEESGKILDEQSGELRFSYAINSSRKKEYNNSSYGISGPTADSSKADYGKKGGASRFFYCPKTSKTDRNEGNTTNQHPTVKPTALMAYLIRLVTPKGGTTLDPFMGSGSTGKAAIRGGFDFVGIEREEEYMEIATARIQYEIDNPYNEEKEERIEVNKNSQKFW
jgi:DNA modification methylase